MTRSGGDSQGTFHQTPNRKKYCDSPLAPKELGLYYLQSRYYDPELCRFLNADAFVSTGQGELGNNMFTYCLNNPVCMADYLGADAIYVVTTGEDGLPLVGHALLYVQNADGSWYMTHFTGPKDDPTKARIELSYVSLENINAYLASDGVNHIYISGDFSASYELAKRYDGTDYGGYCLLTNNCLHYVKELLRKGTPNSMLYSLAFTRLTIVPIVFYTVLSNTQVAISAVSSLKEKNKGSKSGSQYLACYIKEY